MKVQNTPPSHSVTILTLSKVNNASIGNPDLGELFGRDRPLTLTRIFKDLSGYHIPFDLCESKHRAKVRTVAESIVQCLAKHELESLTAWTEGEGWQEFTGWTSYSLNKNQYTGRPQRAEGIHYTAENIRKAVDWLADCGVVEDQRQKPGSLRGKQSRMRLTDLYAGETVAQDTVRRGIRAKRKFLIEVRDDDKKAVKFAHPDIFRLERQMRDVNRYIAELDIRLSGAVNHIIVLHYTARRYNPVTRRKEAMTCRYVVDERTVEVYRAFNRNSLELGGRLYGPFWQNLKKEHRARIRLNGHAVVEVDFASLHPRIAYAEAGMAMKGDPYTITADIVGEIETDNETNAASQRRDAIKRALNTAINAEDDAKAVAAIMDPRKGRPPFTGKGAQAKTEALLKAILNAHPAISDKFCTGAGLRYQRIDSEILLAVIARLEHEHLHGLPLHDAFLTPANEADLVAKIMADELQNTFPNVDLGHGLVIIKEGGLKRKPSNGLGKIYLHNGGSGCSGGVARWLEKNPLEANNEGFRYGRVS